MNKNCRSCEGCWDCVGCMGCRRCVDCVGCMGCEDCGGCRNCEELQNGFMCYGLKFKKKDSKKFWIFNKEVSKKEWDKRFELGGKR